MLRAFCDGGPGRLEARERYLADDMIDSVPQTPFMMVIRSASRKFLLERVQCVAIDMKGNSVEVRMERNAKTSVSTHPNSSCAHPTHLTREK